MKLRPLMKSETGGDFHMVMGKGDSVLVSGFSFIGTEEQMRKIHAERGDAMLHHVVTVGGDTTQGGAEGYAAIFAQLAAVKKFAPDAKSISIVSDAGSGFKSTACAFGLFWASHLGLLPGKLKIVSWLYPAAGEVKLAETDGKMPMLKRRRWQAISAKAIVTHKMPKAAMATTPATNVACMKYNGGGKAETICMIDLGTPKARAARPHKKPITVAGISSIHYMEAETTGVRVWHVAKIGPGKLISWEEIKRHHHGKEVVNPEVPLIEVEAAIDRHRDVTNAVSSKEFEPKIHRSHQNVKARKKRKAIRAADRRRAYEHKYELSVQDFVRRYDEEILLKCKWCSQVFSSIKARTKHQKCVCTRKRGKEKEDVSRRVQKPVQKPAPTTDPGRDGDGYGGDDTHSHSTA